MHKFLNILSNVYSIVLHPMLMPLYGMILFCVSIQQLIPTISIKYLYICLIGTLILTLIIPVILLIFLWRKGYIDSLHIHDSKQRTTPYIYTLTCYSFWAYFLHVTMQLPMFLFIIAIGAVVALLAVTIINHWWKISAHLTGIGGLLGGICSFSLNYSIMPIKCIMIVLVLALLLMYARLHLDAHSPLQVVCGFLLGLLCTFIPTFIFISFYA